MKFSVRYFLTREGCEEREVTKEEFVLTEQSAGFYNTLGRPSEPATGGFGSSMAKVSGRVEYLIGEVNKL